MLNLEKYTGERHMSRQWPFVLLIIVLAILYTSFFSYSNWNSTIGGWIINALSILFVIHLALCWPKGTGYNFKTEILLLILLSYTSCINTYIFYGQSFYDSIRALTGNFVWVFYFFLHRYRVQEATILKAFLIISLFIVGVQTVQQFTYPNALFGIYSEDNMVEYGLKDMAEQRNGIWRFRMHQNGYFTAPVLFAILMWVRKRINTRLIFIMAILFVSIYLTLTRQVIGACLLAVFMSFFIGRKNKGMIRALILGVVIFSLLYAYSDVLFGSLAEQTTEDLTDDNIRIFAATYFWNESIESPLLFLFGHGVPAQYGAFAQLTNYNNLVLRFYTVDVGFIGKIYDYGVIYVLICFFILWKIFFKLKNVVPLYMRMFVIFTGVMSIMIFPMTSTRYFFVWTCMLYICDLYINRAKTTIDYK